MEKGNLLIQSKLRLPFIRANLVSRPQLQSRIEEGIHGPLTLVTAPAGFGKTTLVASYVENCGLPVAWLSLDKNDNQVSWFLTYLVAALNTANSRIGIEAAQIISGIQQAIPEVIMTNLINDLENINTEIVLVLDDYHMIKNQVVHETVAFLLEHQPALFHLVIASRSDPPLPIARLRAHGQTVELRAADLRFSESEAAEFLNQITGLNLDESSVAILEKRTEGWIAGLQMAALSMRDRKDVIGFIEGFSGTNRFILDFLLEEVLANQPPEIQHFLLYTSILERLTAPLCEALLDCVEKPDPRDKQKISQPELSSLCHAARIIMYLEQENLFLISLDDERTWFRYHHLFSDLLRARLRQNHPETIPSLHMRASTWLEQKGFYSEAIQHLFAAHEYDYAANLIERYGPMRWAENDPSIFQMADNLPPEILNARPKLTLYQIWLNIIQGDIRKALPLLNNMAQQFADAGHNFGQRWIRTIVGLALAFLGQPVNFPGFDPLPDDQLLDEIPADEVILRDAADMFYAMTLGRRGEYDRAVQVSEKFIKGKIAPHVTSVIPTLVPFLARIYLIQGRLHSAASLCHEYLDPIKEQGFRFIISASSMYIVLGEVLYEWNCLDEAEQQIREGLHANKPWAEILTDCFGLLALTRVLLAKGDYSGAMEIADKFETRLQGPLRPHEFEEELRTLRVRAHLASGDLKNISEWVEQIQNSEDFHLHRELYQLTLARIYLLLGEYAKVEAIKTSMHPKDTSGNLITRQLEYDLTQAVVLGAQNHFPEAFKLLESCLALAEPEGYVRIFLDMGEPVRVLLSVFMKSDAWGHKQYAQKILDAFAKIKETDLPDQKQAGLIEPLSERELEVLHLIALGRTNQEIAQELIVARGTIKAHAASIYRKLDVDNRTEAVARARQLGILS